MFKKNRNKNQQNGSRESVDSSCASSSENLAVGKDVKDNDGKILHLEIRFKVAFLGKINELSIIHSKKRDTDAQLIDKIEEAQIKGAIPLSSKEAVEVNIHINRHGIKVIDLNGQDVLQRHPLHTICQMITYVDGIGKQNLALKTGQVGKNEFQCYLFQCHSEDQAQSICLCVKKIFDAIAKI